ncbi:MAG: hypothetical protein Q9191_000517 [Dirinaria sp. TL-2023a]
MFVDNDQEVGQAMTGTSELAIAQHIAKFVHRPSRYIEIPQEISEGLSGISEGAIVQHLASLRTYLRGTSTKSYESATDELNVVRLQHYQRGVSSSTNMPRSRATVKKASTNRENNNNKDSDTEDGDNWEVAEDTENSDEHEAITVLKGKAPAVKKAMENAMNNKGKFVREKKARRPPLSRKELVEGDVLKNVANPKRRHALSEDDDIAYGTEYESANDLDGAQIEADSDADET